MSCRSLTGKIIFSPFCMIGFHRNNDRPKIGKKWGRALVCPGKSTQVSKNQVHIVPDLSEKKNAKCLFTFFFFTTKTNEKNNELIAT